MGTPCRELPPEIIRRLPVRFTFDNNYFNASHQGVPEEGYTALIEGLLEGSQVRLGVDYLKERSELRALASRVIYTGALMRILTTAMARWSTAGSASKPNGWKSPTTREMLSSIIRMPRFPIPA